jgi:hypothetical protein
MFSCVSDYFLTARKSVENGPNLYNLCTNLNNEVTLKFFATNAPDQTHWTLNSCFGAFWTVSSLYKNPCKTGRTGAISGQARATKPRQNFWNECTRFTPLDRKPMFWGVLDCFVTALKAMQNGSNWCKLRRIGAISAQIRSTKSC